jgi:hypothetical protein
MGDGHPFILPDRRCASHQTHQVGSGNPTPPVTGSEPQLPAGGTGARVHLRTGRLLAGCERTVVVYWRTRTPPPAACEDKPTGPFSLDTHRRRRQTHNFGPRPPDAGWRNDDPDWVASVPVGTETHCGPPADVCSMWRNLIGDPS